MSGRIAAADRKHPTPVPFLQPQAPQAPAPAQGDRRHAHGSICLPCTLSARHGLTHECITSPGTMTGLIAVLPSAAWRDLVDELGAHPARPLDGDGVRRGVHKSWCFCGCRTRGGGVS